MVHVSIPSYQWCTQQKQASSWLTLHDRSKVACVRVQQLPDQCSPAHPGSTWEVSDTTIIVKIRSSPHTDAAQICWIDKTCDELVTVEPCYSKPLKCGHLAFPLTAIHYNPWNTDTLLFCKADIISFSVALVPRLYRNFFLAFEIYVDSFIYQIHNGSPMVSTFSEAPL